MKSKFILLTLALFAFAGSAVATEQTAEQLIAAQQEIIKLQQEKMVLQQQIVKRYKAGRICYTRQSSCHDARQMVSLLSNHQVSIEATCTLETISDQSSDCYGDRWFLNTHVRILSN